MWTSRFWQLVGLQFPLLFQRRKLNGDIHIAVKWELGLKFSWGTALVCEVRTSIKPGGLELAYEVRVVPWERGGDSARAGD